MFDIIVACDITSGGIGRHGCIPWNIKEDMRSFKKITTDAPEGMINAVIMGRRTWESLPGDHTLPGRVNIVVSTTSRGSVPGFDTALQKAKDVENMHRIFIIGGQRLYEEAIAHPECHTIHLTKVMFKIPQPAYDAYFPLANVVSGFRESETSEWSAGSDDSVRYCFSRWERRT